jgi:outer membrane receptor protein involved in Fe transport
MPRLEDVQARFSYDLSGNSTVTFSVLESYSSLNRSSDKANLGIDSLMEAGYHYTLTNLGWRYSPTNKLLIVNHAAWMREKYDDSSPAALPLDGGYYGEWVWNSTATWMWSEQAPLEAGFSVRRIRDRDFSDTYNTAAGAPRVLDHADGTAVRMGGYLQQSWSGWSGRLKLTAGARWDDQSIDRVSTVSPQASASIGLTQTTRLQFGWGEYPQYPEIAVLMSPLGNRALLPERSIHAVGAVDQRLGGRTRLRAEFYNRADRDMLFQPFYDPRILNGRIFSPPPLPLYYNSLRWQRHARSRLSQGGWNARGGGNYILSDVEPRPDPVCALPAHRFPCQQSVDARPVEADALRRINQLDRSLQLCIRKLQQLQ